MKWPAQDQRLASLPTPEHTSSDSRPVLFQVKDVDSLMYPVMVNGSNAWLDNLDAPKLWDGINRAVAVDG